MVFLKLLLISCLTFITAKAFRNDTNIELYEKHLDIFHVVIPEHYNIQLEPDVETNIFHGECNISIHVRVITQSLILYSKIKCINDIILTNNPPRYYGYVKDMIVYPIEYNKVNDRIDIYFRNFLLPGNYILNIKYHGIINHETKVTTLYKQKYEWWLMPMHFDILGARQVFPCLSEFFRATFNIIIKHHRDYAALSNMAVQKVEEDDEDMMLTHFQTTPLLFTYLVAGIVTNFTHNSTASLNTNLWYRNSSALDMNFASHVIKYTTLYLKKKWYRGHEIRSPKVNHIAIPNFSDKNMMNLGLVIYREEDIIYDEKLDHFAHKIEISHLIGYKISQEWFYQFSDTIWKSTTFWFNDCLLRFLGIYAVDKAVPKLHIMNLFVVQSHHEVLDFDTSYKTSSYNNSYEFPRCIKVFIILRMLLNTLYENTFWRYIRTYVIKTYLDYNNLMPLMSENRKNIKYMGISNINNSELLDMLHKIDPWTKQKHYPTISVKRVYDFPGKMEVLIENYNSSHQYYIPLTCTVQKELDFNDTTPYYSIQERKTHLMNKILTNRDWVIFNIQQIGYYRVNYDLKNWKKIAHYLATINYTQIHVLNRAQIIDDAFHFMITKQLDSATFWKITEYLEHELNFVAWYPMFKALEYMSSVFPLSEIESVKIKQRMQNILHKVYQELPHKKIKKDDDTRKRLKQEVAKWACFFDDQKCKEIAKHNLIRSLREAEKFKLLPWWREWTYCNGLKISSYPDIINDKNSTWWEVYHMGKENFKSKILEYLACFEHPDFITDYLNLIGNNNETSIMSLKDFRVQDRINCFLSTIAKYARKNKVLNFIINKFMEIKPNEINKAVIFTVLINHLYSEEQLEKVNEFVITNLTKLQSKSVKKLEENLDKPLDEILKIITSIKQQQEKDYVMQFYKQIEIKIKLRSHQIESQIQYLNTLVI